MNKQERRRYRNNAIEKVKELYRSDRILEKYRADIGILEEKITRKREEQKSLSGLDSDPEEGFSISFEEKVTFSPNNTSNAERKTI